MTLSFHRYKRQTKLTRPICTGGGGEGILDIYKLETPPPQPLRQLGLGGGGGEGHNPYDQQTPPFPLPIQLQQHQSGASAGRERRETKRGPRLDFNLKPPLTN